MLQRLFTPAAMVALLAVGAVSGGCRSEPMTEVIVLGMIHSQHRTSDLYGADQIAAVLTALEPDAILCEIPPDRLHQALAEYRENGAIEEPRVARFPEYVDVVIPMHAEHEWDLVPCAAWTRAMANDRRAKLQRWEQTRPEDMARVNEAQADADERIALLGSDDDPLVIHTVAYDELVRAGLEPYDRLFNDDLGTGGWANINAAHWALIAEELDRRRGSGDRVVITFGSWHKHLFLDQLRARDDVGVVDPRPYFK